jgi:hypothetical protein
MKTIYPVKKRNEALVKVLSAHYKALVEARSDEFILKQYSNLLRYLRSSDCKFLENSGSSDVETSHREQSSLFSNHELRNATLNELEALIDDESTPRRGLESIAIERFSVPKGSMRSFPNRKLLIDKLRTLIRNERAHETIGIVAREND